MVTIQTRRNGPHLSSSCAIVALALDPADLQHKHNLNSDDKNELSPQWVDDF